MKTKQDLRSRARHSRRPLAIGTTRIRRKNKRGYRARFIKVSNHRRGWMLYAKFLWERENGPVPPGLRVIHLDGDPLNDSLDNLTVATPGDVVGLWHLRDPAGSKENYRKASAATAEMNRQRGQVNRHRNWLPTRWYPVYVEEGYAINDPHRSRLGLLAKYAPGIPVACNGRVARSDELEFTPLRGREIEQLEIQIRKVEPDETEENHE